MTNEQNQNLSDLSMLDLFRSEVETHTATLSEGLQALEQNPSANLEALMRAAHSIKGGARIVELDVAAQISQVMEECFVAAQKGDVTLRSKQLKILFQGVDMLRQIADAAGESMAAWLIENQEKLDQLVAAITGIMTPGTPDSQEPSLPEELQEEKKPLLSSLKPVQRQKPQPTIKFSGGSTDESMLELFRTEMETHITTLTSGLLTLEDNPGAIDQLEALMRAAHSIKGGARVVELDAAVQIAHVMEDCFVAAQKNEITLNSEHIDILLQGVDMLNQIAAVAGEGVTEWLARHQTEIQHLFNAIFAILSGETPPPISPAKIGSQVVAPPTTPTVKPEPRSGESLPVISGPTSKAQVARTADEEKPLQLSSEAKDRLVRVTAAKIERLMGLGGEVVVSARWLPPFSESLLALKKTHNELFSVLEKLQGMLGTEEKNREPRSLVLQAREKIRECSFALADRLNQLDMFTSMSANLSDRLYQEVIGVRMRPFADGVRTFPRMVRDLAKKLGKKVKLEISGKSTEVDRDILEKLDAPLTHLFRNAIDHGIELPAERLAVGKPETGILRLEAAHRAGMLMITLSDDGRGIDLAKIRQKILAKDLADASIADHLTEAELMEFLFLPGFSTASDVTEISGRGVGLDVVHDMVHEVGGFVRAVSTPGKGVSFHLELPLTLSVIRTFLVEIHSEPYAFPLARIDRCVVLSEEDLEIVEDRQYFRFDNSNIALVDIRDVLGIEEPASG
jgi:two-component system sensor histidine kinase and response regulator WspE